MTRFWLPVLLAFSVLSPAVAVAQSGPDAEETSSSDVDQLIARARVESVRGNHDAALSAYVRAIARRPNDAAILSAAGQEALAIGDSDAAFGFLGRAVMLNPRDPAARAAYGSALVLSARPKDALTLFDQAVRLGMAEAEVAGDRGLARDLLGENRRAQRDYRLALSVAPRDSALIQRLGLSLAISGDREAAISLVQPLVRGNGSRDAARSLAFIHALTGDVTAARKIAVANMSSGQADALTPFFARISVLNAEEKAAAVHLGRLPLVRLTRKEPVVPKRVKRPDGSPSAMRAVANGDTPPVIEDKPAEAAAPRPSDTEARAAAKAAKASKDEKTDKSEKAEKAPSRSSSRMATAESNRAAEAEMTADGCSALSGSRKIRCEADARALARRCAKQAGKPTAECRDYEASLARAKEKTPPLKEKAAPAEARAEALDALSACEGLTGSKGVQCRADARALERRCGGANPQKTAECQAYSARREAAVSEGRTAEGKAKAKDSAKVKDGPKTKAKEKASERYWVQIAGGRNKNDFAKEWARLKAKSPALLRRQAPYLASSGATFRLLVGPFDSSPAAREFINKLNAAGISSFPWTSAAGEDVEKMVVK